MRQFKNNRTYSYLFAKRNMNCEYVLQNHEGNERNVG
uniref:Uncharacterized protein n=1 Tax=Rhizophora mucronata TaxID=61149 RepID=A0A2P2NQU6_RHIMU